MHIFNVTRPKDIFDGTDRLEQHGFADGVKDHQKDGRPDRLLLADSGTGDDQTEIGDRGEGQHLFAVVLRDRHHAACDKGKASDQGNHRAAHRSRHCGGKADQQIHARLDHRGAVQQSA